MAILVRKSRECTEIEANDGCRLRELLHPDRGAPGLPYSLAVAFIDPGQSTLPHRLTGEAEVYYIVRGRGTLHVDGETREVEAGDAAVVPAGAEQWIVCDGDERLEFLNLVSPPWRADHDIRTDRG